MILSGAFLSCFPFVASSLFFLPIFFPNFVSFFEFLFLSCLTFVSNKETLSLSLLVINFSSIISIIFLSILFSLKIFLILSIVHAPFILKLLFKFCSNIFPISFVAVIFEFFSFIVSFKLSSSNSSSSLFWIWKGNTPKIVFLLKKDK